MFDRDAAWASLHDPATDAATLAEVAAAYPEFAEAVARHPNAYPELIAWAAQATASAGAAMLATESPTPQRPPSVPVGSRARRLWIAVLGVVLIAPILASAVFWLLIALFVDDYSWGLTVRFLPAGVNAIPGVAVAVLGAVAAPTAGRRVGVIVLGLAASIVPITLALGLIYGTVLGVRVEFLGPLFVSVLLFLAWAVGRPLRGAAYAALPVVVALEIGLLGLHWGVISVTGWNAVSNVALVALRLIVTLLVVWLALTWSRASERRLVARPLPAPAQPGFVHMPVVTASGVPGAPHVAYVVVPAAPRTNTMAVMALVFSFIVSLLGVIFGHVALAQISRTGESGRGMAIAGLVIGYIGLALGVLTVVFYGVMLGTLIGH